MKNNLLNKLSPYERMAKMYEENPREHPFSWYVVWHQINGFCFATPDFFIMGSPVNHCVARREITDCTSSFDPGECHCWFIHAMAGDMSKAWSILPYELPFIAFERFRDGELELQILPLNRIRRITQIHPA